MGPQSSLAEKTADRLREDLAANPVTKLPSAGVLAQRYGVGRVTMHRALHLLAERGLVQMSRGSRARSSAGGADRLPFDPPPSAADRLFDALSNRITSGLLASGTPLPKASYLVNRFKVSTHTVGSACRMLLKHGLIHKRGRHFIVGQHTSGDVEAMRPYGEGAIVLIQPKVHAWRGLAEAERTVRFCMTFSQEAERHGIQLLPAVFGETGQTDLGNVRGWDAILDRIRSLGSEYYGSLIVGSGKEIAGCEERIVALCRFGKPVAWFDRYDEPGAVGVGTGTFVRCHFSEPRAVKLAADHLCRLGHKVIAFPISERSPWRERRLALLRTYIQAAYPGVRVVSLPRKRLSLPEDELRRMVSGLSTVTKTGPDVSRHRLEAALLHMERAFLWLSPYLLHPEITALVAPNDNDAARIYYWLGVLGMSLPRDMSLLSFDNYIRLQPYPVSSIDFGFGHIGYCAFHSILDDITIKRDPQGNIPALPHVVRRGSVGPPRD